MLILLAVVAADRHILILSDVPLLLSRGGIKHPQIVPDLERFLVGAAITRTRYEHATFHVRRVDDVVEP